MTHRPIQLQRSTRGRARGFTIIELLVAIGIIAVLSTLTVVSVASFANDIRLSTGVNQVLRAVEDARAEAIRTNRPVMVVARVDVDYTQTPPVQRTELVTVTWNGRIMTSVGLAGTTDIYERVENFAPRRLPVGVKVAGPFYALGGTNVDLDVNWITQPELSETDPTAGGTEQSGQYVGVLFGPNGELMLGNNRSPSDEALADFNLGPTGNGDGDGDGTPYDDNAIGAGFGGARYWYNEEGDDTYISVVPFLAVFDDAEARELKGGQSWASWPAYQQLVGPNGFISRYGERISFNRYTGVAMR